MKMHRHFKQHWKDDYPWVEHDQHVLQGMQITLYVRKIICEVYQPHDGSNKGTINTHQDLSEC